MLLRLIPLVILAMVILGYLTAIPVAGILKGDPGFIIAGLILGVPAHITAWIIAAVVRDTRGVRRGMRWIKTLVAVSYVSGILLGFWYFMTLPPIRW